MNPPLITIAIDGYSSSGKSTMAKQLARTLGYRYVDSGAMYRAVTLAAMRRGLVGEGGSGLDSDAVGRMAAGLSIDFAAGTDGTQHTLLNGEDVEREIRSMPVSSAVSAVAAIPAVRHRLVELQRSYGTQGGIVMDGRDIGTTVFPHAQLKVFVNASAATRAERRYRELTAKGVATTFEEVLRNVESRDHIDRTREESPLRRAADAVDLDNSDMTPDEQNERLLELYHIAIANAQHGSKDRD